MKTLLVSTVPVNVNNVTIHARNAVAIKRSFEGLGENVRLVWDESQIDPRTQYDHIIFTSATGYFKFEKFEELMDRQQQARIGWIANEFELFQNNFLKGRTDYIIANFPPEAGKKANTYKTWLTTNLNALAISPQLTVVEKDYDFCYYGSYRKHRIPYFKKWLRGDTILSTSKKNWHKFASLGCDCKVTPPFEWGATPTLARFRSSLYIEDTKTHEFYNYLANRFYECLNCYTIPIFDPSCLGTIRRSPEYLIPHELVYTDPHQIRVSSYFFDHNRLRAFYDKEKCLREIHKFVCDQ